MLSDVSSDRTSRLRASISTCHPPHCRHHKDASRTQEEGGRKNTEASEFKLSLLLAAAVWPACRRAAGADSDEAQQAQGCQFMAALGHEETVDSTEEKAEGGEEKRDDAVGRGARAVAGR